MAMGQVPIPPDGRYRSLVDFWERTPNASSRPASRPAELLFSALRFASAVVPGGGNLQQCLLVARIHYSRQANTICRILPVFLRFQQHNLLSPRTLNAVYWNFVLQQCCEGDLLEATDDRAEQMTVSRSLPLTL